jgi:hypothetical protein
MSGVLIKTTEQNAYTGDPTRNLIKQAEVSQNSCGFAY